MPYRSHYIESDKRVAEPGIVSDMVRQFADKHAFLRELVQNGIDAGATRIDVRIDRDDEGIVRTSVTDDGSGMTRATMEGPFLTLFSSSKEGDKSKIGKYGIGFVSVFALEPDVVEVQTRNDESWLLKLFGDHTWELNRGDPNAPKGTTVTLVQPMPVEGFQSHVTSATRALSKWCRHARIPIELTILDAGDPNATRVVLIQEPFEGSALVTASWQEGDEKVVVAAGGLDPLIASFAGYYNRGLTLHETTAADHAIPGIRFKIDSPKLSHTLSRDNVVRDGELRRLQAIVHDLVHGKLAQDLETRVREAATSAISANDYVPILQVAANVTFADKFKKAGDLLVPLVDPVEIDGQRRMALRIKALREANRKILIADIPSALTRALARSGRPVVRWRAVGAPLATLLPDSWLARFEGEIAIEEAEYSIAWAGPVAERHAGDDALEAAIVKLLQKVGKNVGQARLALFEGLGKPQPFRVLDTKNAEAIVEKEEMLRRAWGRNATIFVNVEDAGVRLARRRAKSDPVVAAHLLCRALLVGDGPLDAKTVDRFLEAAFE